MEVTIAPAVSLGERYEKESETGAYCRPTQKPEPRQLAIFPPADRRKDRQPRDSPQEKFQVFDAAKNEEVHAGQGEQTEVGDGTEEDRRSDFPGSLSECFIGGLENRSLQ